MYDIGAEWCESEDTYNCSAKYKSGKGAFFDGKYI